MKEFLVFGGTIEGRRLVETLLAHQKKVHLCVASEYGEEVMDADTNLTIHQGRLDLDDMKNLLDSEDWEQVIDATHPYAAIVSQNIKNACIQTGKEYIRLLRPKNSEIADSQIVYVDSPEEAAEYLNQTEGNILFTTGSKDLSFYIGKIEDISRIYVRILPEGAAVSQCKEKGLEGKQIICMQGPFSAELNEAMLKQIEAAILVTKETGNAGGFQEKIQGAKRAGAVTIVIRRPVEETGYSMEELLNKLHLSEKRESEQLTKAVLLGIGMGGLDDLTLEGQKACRDADVILGAPRMTEALKIFGKDMASIYRPEEIADYIKSHPEKKEILVAFSGDVGFYSGTKKLLDTLKEMKIEIKLIPGISSVVYFASRLQIPWEDVKLVSIHGRNQNLLAAVKSNRKVFSLAGYKESIHNLCQSLIENHLEHVTVSVGCQLGYPNESIVTGKPEELLAFDEKGLCVVIIENAKADQYVVTHGLPDEVFERGNAPMTKEEIRSISLSKLALTKNAVVYDVGAGTGSIGLECALQATDGMVYAIEKKKDALDLLVKNKKHLGVSNLEIIEGLAPEAFRNLPAPTHAFIGGSSGNMKEIVELLLVKNPNVRIVINCIALETVAEVMNFLKNKKFRYQDIVHAAIGKSKILGSYHMMMGQNPVYIITLQEELV